MKTKEELTALKNEVEALSGKLTELSEAELIQVTGGVDTDYGFDLYEIHKRFLETQKALKEQAEALKANS